ncbi:DUF418 domain-containing protein [Spirosoma jeollabukense]
MIHAFCRPVERITTLDVLWGLVLLGLLISQAFGPLAYPQPVHMLHLAHHPAELPVQFMIRLLVSGQFERMGSFLFGLGVYRCWGQAGPDGPGLDGPGRTDARLDGPGLDGHRIVRRLLIGLLGIGLGLSLLLRSVDLLVQYSLLGFTLLYFVNQSVVSLLSWMVGITLLAMLMLSIVGLLHPASVTSHGLFGWQSVRHWLLTGNSVSQDLSSVLSYELMMLGGLLVGKLAIVHPDQKLRVRLSLLQLGLLPTAFLLKGAWVVMALGLVVLPPRVIDYQFLLLSLSGFLGTLLLTGVYLLDVAINTRIAPSGWARWIGWIGRFGLSNYVFQSMLCTLLLYEYRIVAPGPLPAWGRGTIVVGIYSFQIGLSWLWRKHHRLGPLEWVCRYWLYGKAGPSNSVTTAKL